MRAIISALWHDNSNTTLVKVKLSRRKAGQMKCQIQIQHLLKLNRPKVPPRAVPYNSNTTLVKVKFIVSGFMLQHGYNSNTTLVKVKSYRPFMPAKPAQNSNTTLVKVKL